MKWFCVVLCAVLFVGCSSRKAVSKDTADLSVSSQADGGEAAYSREAANAQVSPQSDGGEAAYSKEAANASASLQAEAEGDPDVLENHASENYAYEDDAFENTSDVKLHFLCVTIDDVGCDAILIESGGEFGFVDCGAYAEKDWTLQIMDELGVTPDNLKFIIGTHAHGDHIGLMDYLIYSYHLERVYVLPFAARALVKPEEWKDMAWKNAMAQADARGVPVVSAFQVGASEEPWKQKKNPTNRYVASPHITFGNAQIDIYNYSRDYLTEKVGDANDTSLVVKLTAGGHTALLTGDLSNAPGRGIDPGYDEVAIANEIGHVDILKLPHHGIALDDANAPEDLQKFSASYLVQTGPTHFLCTGNGNLGIQKSFQEVLREVKMGTVYVSTYWFDRRIIGDRGLSAITFDMATLENNIPDSYAILPVDREGRSYMFRGGRLSDFTLDKWDVYISNGKKNEAGYITVDDITYTINGDSKIVGANGQKWERFR